MNKLNFSVLFLLLVIFAPALAQAEQVGSIRGVIFDKDFDVPLAQADVTISEIGQKVTATEEGNYVFGEVPPGTYTLVFSKEGYTRQVVSNVVVSPGQVTDADAFLAGEFTEMDEFVVQDIQLAGAGTETSLLGLRIESSALLDSIGAELMSKAGASDAAGALKLVSGATVQGGKFAVIRGLPDRYVNSQMNSVRLPSADADKRAVQLDQFPSEVIESIQVSKTFTPDQQGDASGGAVNVKLKGIPDETVFKVKYGNSFNSQVSGNEDFLTKKGETVGLFESSDDRNDQNKQGGPAGTFREEVPSESSPSISIGGKHEFDNGIKVGGFGNSYYKRSSSYYEDGKDDSMGVETVGGPLIPLIDGIPNFDENGNVTGGDFKTALFDVTEGVEEVQTGGLAVVGVETENHSLDLLFMQTKVTENKATLSEDTRGKAYFFPDYNPNNPSHQGNEAFQAAPYLRTETLTFTERSTNTLQLDGKHTLPFPEIGKEGFFMMLHPEIDWTLATSLSALNQPDKRQFGSLWTAEKINPGFPPFIPPFTEPAEHGVFKPAANINLGNYQRVWKDIEEDSDQYFWNWKIPFKQWSDDEGYFKMGRFRDKVDREYNQDSYTNLDDDDASFKGEWESSFSEQFSGESHPVSPSDIDVDYRGEQEISAWYYMTDMPLTSSLNVIGGIRFEDTNLTINNTPEAGVTWIHPGDFVEANFENDPSAADVSFEQEDKLPAIAFVLTPTDKVTARTSYTQTVARQTFKELTPIMQTEYLGADVFIGNPDLAMSEVENFDFRFDFTPYNGGLFSYSWFRKDIRHPIEYVQKRTSFGFKIPVNYPKGRLRGHEIEVRQDMGKILSVLNGLMLGGNATLIKSEVTLPKEEAELFTAQHLNVDLTKRDMTNTPEHLYNLFLTYELESLGAEFSFFYTVKGDTLVAGAGQDDSYFIPNVYEKEYGTVNLSFSQKIGDLGKLVFQIKNLTNPDIEEVYRSSVTGGDKVKTAYQKGIDYSLSFTTSW